MSDQLKPCPFCGGAFMRSTTVPIVCPECGAKGPNDPGYDNEAAIVNWNRRAKQAVAKIMEGGK
jgi:hypothetical protein